MKKLTFLALAAALATSANAQYQVDPSTQTVIDGGVSSVDYILLSDGAVADFTSAGAKVTYLGPSPDEGRNLWYWDGLTPADDSFPRVDMEEGGYTSVQVTGTAGWSGAGFNIANSPGVDLSHFDENTRFHLAYMSPTGNGPASIAVILLDNGDNGSQPAKFALGDAFNDNGVIFPSVGAKINDDWQGIDITLGDLKKLWPTFDLQNKSAWGGNIFSWLGGNVAGQTMAFDAMYFYNAGNSGVAEVGADNATFIVTANTVNSTAAGIELYDLNGRKVKATASTTLGISDLSAGIYVAKSGNAVKKIVVK